MAQPWVVSSIDSQEVGMSGAFPSMHRRRIVVYLPTCQPEDPGTRDASVQVGVTCEDKATQWEEREAADPSLDKSLGAYSKSLPQSRSLNSLGFAGNGEDDFLGHSNGHSQATSCPPGPASSCQAVNNLLRRVRRAFCLPPHDGPDTSPAPARERKHRNVGSQLRTWLRKHRGRVHPHPSEDHQ
ncbi:UNVERIFIED_CONTAM: hypothetical protein K2H54_011991 [Gekko kuhli]